MAVARSELRDLLNEWDPIGVMQHEWPESWLPDAYDGMIAPLLERLERGDTTPELCRYLDVYVPSHFGVAPGRYSADFVGRLVSWWNGSPATSDPM